MKKLDTVDMANIMLDFAHGKEIFYKRKNESTWHLTSTPCWDWESFDYTSEDPYPNEDHEMDYDDSSSAYYLGGHATMEDYAEAAEWDAYDPYADDF